MEKKELKFEDADTEVKISVITRIRFVFLALCLQKGNYIITF